jgi:hypothetical protein
MGTTNDTTKTFDPASFSIDAMWAVVKPLQETDDRAAGVLWRVMEGIANATQNAREATRRLRQSCDDLDASIDSIWSHNVTRASVDLEKALATRSVLLPILINLLGKDEVTRLLGT